ncbi:dihydrofolate reductase [Allosphingosinicella flava]|uniref:Dihydrofolate reductase n=2 Tax=Allosphingosinicella flava TaxID=2771430 RepID=A0A7T2LN34_9SPHN|nr:dihydrofolate reductase [Sphingosinicella flava]
MRKVIGAAFISLDGVMQAPGGPDEDTTGGFALGGWLFNSFDEEVGQQIDRLFSGDFDLLLGRRTYDIFAAYWPFVEGEDKALGARFDRAAKYVVTRGDQPLPWQNSHRVPDMSALAELKRGDGPDLIIQGSSTLYPQLLKAGLIDRLTVMTFPVVLGSGKRLFGDGTPPLSMRMIDHEVTGGGTVIATYEPDGGVKPGSFQAIPPTAAELERRHRMKEGLW